MKIQVTAVYTVEDKDAVKSIKKQYRREVSEYKKNLEKYIQEKETFNLKNIGDPPKEPDYSDVEIPTKEDKGIVLINLGDIELLNESDNPNYTLVSLYSGIQILCDYPISKFKEYLRKTYNYQIDELN